MSSALTNKPNLAPFVSETVASPTPLKFLLDAELQRLTYWLRTAGYDVATIEQDINENNDINIDPYYLIQQAKQENRILITTNNMYSHLRGTDKYLLLLSSTAFKQQRREFSNRIQINWQLAPLTRCINCNKNINVANQNDEFDSTFCPHCQQLTWDNSEKQKITNQLQQWNQD